jgi:tetratricopeptide (TPR) repeat protein
MGLDPVRQVLQELSARCLLEEAFVGLEAEGCPAELAQHVARVVAGAVGTSEDRVKVGFKVAPDALRDLLLASIAAGLPPQERKVLVLGLDGLDWDLVLPWVRAGKMPNLARLMESGTWGVMETLVPTLSPLIWTSMATGVGPDRHGILDFVEKDPVRNVMVPVTGRSRKVPAIWNLASALGRRVIVVGWWGSWPAERVNGVMVSDRLYYTLTQGLEKEILREDPPEMIYPPERTEELVGLRNRAVKETDWQAVRYFMSVEEERFEAALAADRGMKDPVDGFRRVLAATRTYLGAGLLLAEEEPDLAMVYLEGTDTVGHLLAPYMPPPTLDVDPAEAEVLVAAVPRYFEIVDRWIGRYLEQYPLSEYAAVLVSDHGFKWSQGRPRGLSATAGPTAPFWHELDAVFLVAGKGVERLGRVERQPSVLDVAPTVAALLGLPPDPGWGDSVLPGCPKPELEPLEYLPLVPPESYRQGEAVAAPVDPEFLAKLRALGYLGGGADEVRVAAGNRGAIDAEETASVADSGKPSAELDSPTVTRAQLNNLAIIKMNEKKYDEAAQLLRRAIRMSPGYPAPHYNLRRLYMETQRYDDADRELWIAVDKGLRDPQRTVDRAAADYENLDMQDRAAALLTEALQRFPEHEPFWVHQMVVRIRLEQCREARDLGAEAARKFPESAPVHAFYGLAAACVGDVSTARTELERSLALNPDQATLRRTLEDLSAEGG